MPFFSALAAIAAAISAATGVANATKKPPEPEGPVGYYQRSMFMPELGGGTGPYAPQNRTPQSSPTPDIINYLSKYVR